MSGVTAVIDADGRVRHTTSLFTSALTTGTVTTTTGETPFVRFGEWVLVGSALALLGAAFAAGLRQRRGVPVDSPSRADRAEGVSGA
jgi:apolipoprotein N-acyltransferase